MKLEDIFTTVFRQNVLTRFEEMARPGGSATPEALLKPLGVDIHDAEFWRKGFEEAKRLIASLKSL